MKATIFAAALSLVLLPTAALADDTCMLASGSVSAAQEAVSFSLEEVMESVSHHPRLDGNKITIDGQAYRAFFDGSGVTLSSWDEERTSRFAIEEDAEPYVEDAGVRYQLPDGEIRFRGTRRGLEYQRIIEDPGFYRYLGDVTIEMNGDGDLARPERLSLSDASGREVPYEVNQGNLRVSQKDVASLEFPLTFEGEFLLDTNMDYAPAACYQCFPTVAFDGTNYLVVWQDHRRYTQICGARVTPSGSVLDPGGIAISKASSTESSPSVAFDGSNYLVVWSDWRNNPGPPYPNADIYGARVDPAGAILDTDGIAISTAPYDQNIPTVAFDGSNYLVVWKDYRDVPSWPYYPDTCDIYGARVDPSGVVLDTAGIAISTGAANKLNPSVAFNGTSYLVVWSDNRNDSDYDIYGARVDPSGVVLDAAGIAISTATDRQLRPSVAFNGTNFLVVWEHEQAKISYDIYGARVDPSGAVLDTAGIAISTAHWFQVKPSVVFNGTNCLVVWYDGRFYGTLEDYQDIYGARVDQSGNVLDPDGIAISTFGRLQDYPALAFDGSNCLVVWQGHPGGQYGSLYEEDIYGVRVSQSGTVLDSTVITVATSAYPQDYPAVAFNGSNYLVVWCGNRGDEVYQTDIYGTRVNPSGVILDPAGIAISTASGSQWYPSVASDASGYLVVWCDHRNDPDYDIYGARVDPAGVVLDSTGIAISTAAGYQLDPSVAFDGSNYLVVWSEDRNDPFNDIYGARVDPAGTVLDTGGIAISTAAEYQVDPSVAFDGSNYLVVWSDNRNDTDYDIYGARVDPAGAVLDTAGIAISTETSYQTNPVLAFDGTNYLVVWEYRNIYGARIDPAGNVLDPDGIVISDAEKSQYNVSVAYDGSNYLVVWQDDRDFQYRPEIYGARVNPSGMVLDADGLALSPQTGRNQNPAIAHGPDHQLLITYSGLVDSINGQPANTMRIWGKFYTTTGADEEPSQACLPQRFVLEQNYPNPFNPMTEIAYSLPKACRVRLTIYNILGQRVATLVDERQLAGYRSLRWDASAYASGVYFYRLQAGDFVETRKMVLLR